MASSSSSSYTTSSRISCPQPVLVAIVHDRTLAVAPMILRETKEPVLHGHDVVAKSDLRRRRPGLHKGLGLRVVHVVEAGEAEVLVLLLQGLQTPLVAALGAIRADVPTLAADEARPLAHLHEAIGALGACVAELAAHHTANAVPSCLLLVRLLSRSRWTGDLMRPGRSRS